MIIRFTCGCSNRRLVEAGLQGPICAVGIAGLAVEVPCKVDMIGRANVNRWRNLRTPHDANFVTAVVFESDDGRKILVDSTPLFRKDAAEIGQSKGGTPIRVTI